MFSELKKYASFVSFSHTIFALPYALLAFFLSAKKGSLLLEEPNLPLVFLLLLISLVSARTAAMSFNRIVDRHYDAKNPRTRQRELISGEVSLNKAYFLLLISCLAFFLCAAALGKHCLTLSPLVLAILFFYSFCKRFTSLSHLVLGLSLALAPGGAWWIIRPRIEIEPLVLMISVLFWVAGFDILYSCQDLEFDKKEKLHSIPVRLGLKNSLRLAFSLHILSFFGFLCFGRLIALDNFYFYGVCLIALILLGQHSLISENNLSRINRAFFTFNGMVSILYFCLVLLTL